MDAMIENGDISLLSCGDAVRLSGGDELIQRVKIAGSVKKGSFVYNKELGSEAHIVAAEDDKALKTAQMLLYEATAQIPDVKIKVKSVQLCENGGVTIAAEVSCRNAAKEITFVL